MLKQPQYQPCRSSKQVVIIYAGTNGYGKKGLGYFRTSAATLASQRIDITDRPTAENAASSSTG
jgi:F0F1-type ATP synthase alpha subunit